MTTPARPKKLIDDPVFTDPSVARLLSALNAYDAKPNVLTAEQLLRFMPVLSKPDAQEFLRTHPGDRGLEMLEQLQREFCAATPRLYSPTVVVTSTDDPTVIYEFPPRLTEVASITPSIDAMLVSGANTNAVQHDPDSAHAERTLTTLLGMLATSQLEPAHIARVAAARRNSEDIVRRMDVVSGRTSQTAVDQGGSSVMHGVVFDLDD